MAKWQNLIKWHFLAFSGKLSDLFLKFSPELHIDIENTAYCVRVYRKRFKSFFIVKV